MSLILIAVVVALGAAAPAGASGLTLESERRLSPRLLELRLRTPAVAEPTGVRVLLPAGYDEQPGRRWPVLYLLHGAADDFESWTVKGDAEAITAGAPFLVVMPDTGTGGGYVDWHNGGAGGPPMWETYHVGQLIPWIDRRFRTVAAREGRAVAGLSMGGFGAMSYAARHPDLFAAAAAFSGAVNSNSLFVQPLTGTEGASQNRPPGSVFGPRATEEVRWRGANPWDLADNLGGMALWLRTGNGMPGGPGGDSGDPIESEVHTEMLTLHERLTEIGIPHLWDDYGAGGHAWFYWQRGLRQLVPDLARTFAGPPAPPDPVVHRTIAPRYEVFGWRVAIERPALEFSRLEAGGTGFVLRGSGRAHVTTPPRYRPGSAVVATVGGERRTLRAGSDCRVTVPVSLGPGNPHQQYTAQARAHGLQESADALSVVPSEGARDGTRVATARVRLETKAPGCKAKRAARKRPGRRRVLR